MHPRRSGPRCHELVFDARLVLVPALVGFGTVLVLGGGAAAGAPKLTTGPWPTRTLSPVTFASSPVLVPGSDEVVGVSVDQASNGPFGRLVGLDLRTGSVATGPLVFADATIVPIGDGLGLSQATAELVGQPGGSDPGRLSGARISFHRILMKPLRLAVGVFVPAGPGPNVIDEHQETGAFWALGRGGLELVNETTGAVLRYIAGIARTALIDPSGRYLLTSTTTKRGPRVLERSLKSAKVRSHLDFAGAIAAGATSATSDRVTIEVSGGMASSTELYSLPGLHRVPWSGPLKGAVEGCDGSRCFGALVGGALLYWDATELSCASPIDARVVAAAPLSGANAASGGVAISPVALIGRTLYLYREPSSGPGSGTLQAISLPASCPHIDGGPIAS